MMSHLEQAYAADIKIRREDEKHPKSGIEVAVQEFFEEGTVYQAEGVKVTAFAVNHGEAIKPAYGYRIDYAGRAVVLSGDTKFDPNVIRHAHGVDLLVHEVAAARLELMDEPATKRVLAHHTSPREAGEVFRQAGPRLAVYTHIVLRSSSTVPEPTIEELVAQTRETYSGPLEIGADLTMFEIGETVTVKRLQP
jgi:ribonuclease Z